MINLPPDKNTVVVSSDDNPYRGPTLEQEPLDAKRMRHSLFGILSFVTALVAVAVAAVMFVIIVSFVLTMVPGQQNGTPDFPVGLRIGALVIVTCVITSIGLGIACLVQNGRKKLFGILGLALSTIIVVGVSGLMFAG